ncbi:MAG: LysR family transcriptional regulator [Sphingopyxis sp.]|nr:LysR family transcriptional regulator [Sphingopyxis sp.]
MNLRQLEAFRAVMLSGSVTQAAQSLNLSQPAVSKMLSDLEHQLGFRLFLRSRGSALTITPEADAFFYEVERSFSGIAALKRVAEDIRNMATGTLRIAALPALAVSFLPQVIGAFRAKHPGVTIQLQTRSSSTVRQWMANQQFDIGLATPARELPGIRMERFLRCAGACVMPPDHRLAAKEVVRPRDLEGEAFISLALEDGARHRIDRIFEDAGVNRNMVIETQYAMTICALVMQGVGCSILNPVTAADFAGRGLVVRPFVPEVFFEYMIFTPRLRPVSQVAVAFVAMLEDHRERLFGSAAS